MIYSNRIVCVVFLAFSFFLSLFIFPKIINTNILLPSFVFMFCEKLNKNLFCSFCVFFFCIFFNVFFGDFFWWNCFFLIACKFLFMILKKEGFCFYYLNFILCMIFSFAICYIFFQNGFFELIKCFFVNLILFPFLWIVFPKFLVSS